MSYRGPQTGRIHAQFDDVLAYVGEACVWRQYASASTGTASGMWGGAGTTRYFREQWITAFWAAPQMGESRFRETQLPGGQVMAGDAILSTWMPLSSQDEVIWRGVTYRIEGDTTPIHIGERLWYRTVVRRGDATG